MTLNDQDARFVMQARPMVIAEIKMSEVAADYASDPRLKRVAQRILQDHTHAYRVLTEMLDGSDLNWSEEAPDPAHEKLIDKLWSLEGAELDQTYVRAQVQDYEQAVRLFEREAAAGHDPALRRYARECLPTLQRHLKAVQDLAKSMQS